MSPPRANLVDLLVLSALVVVLNLLGHPLPEATTTATAVAGAAGFARRSDGHA